jgi:hypothetical protein
MGQENKYIIAEFYTFKPDYNSAINIIKEAELKNTPIIMSGIFQKANTLNRNGRVYPYDVLRREATKYMQLIEDDLAGGELDHPDSAVVSLSKVSHKVLDMWWQGEELYGKVMIAYTGAGDTLKGLLKTGFRLGISSRGVGSVKTVKGEDIVQNDFELIAFDFVSSPSTPGAYMYKESRQWGLTPITEEAYNRIKCENGICRIVDDTIKESTLLTPSNCNIEEQCEKFKKLFTLSNNTFWKNL